MQDARNSILIRTFAKVEQQVGLFGTHSQQVIVRGDAIAFLASRVVKILERLEMAWLRI
jgi:hypothetical protein